MLQCEEQLAHSYLSIEIDAAIDAAMCFVYYTSACMSVTINTKSKAVKSMEVNDGVKRVMQSVKVWVAANQLRSACSQIQR
jgi:hypothetical protein